MALLNPWLLLGVVLALLVSGGGGAYLGYQYRDGQAAVDLHDATVAVVEAARANAAADTKAAVRKAKTRAALEARVREEKLKGDLDAARKNRPECVRDADSLRMLHDFIDVANTTSAAGGMSEPLHDAGPPAGRTGDDDPSVGARPGSAVR